MHCGLFLHKKETMILNLNFPCKWNLLLTELVMVAYCATEITGREKHLFFLHTRKQIIKIFATLYAHFVSLKCLCRVCNGGLVPWLGGLSINITLPEQTWIMALITEKDTLQDVIWFSRKENRKWTLLLFFISTSPFQCLLIHYWLLVIMVTGRQLHFSVCRRPHWHIMCLTKHMRFWAEADHLNCCCHTCDVVNETIKFLSLVKYYKAFKRYNWNQVGFERGSVYLSLYQNTCGSLCTGFLWSRTTAKTM